MAVRALRAQPGRRTGPR